jgi:hypothetical protein
MTYFEINDRVQLRHESAGLAAGAEGIVCDFRFEDGEAYVVRFGLEERDVSGDDLALSSRPAARPEARSEATARLVQLPAIGSRSSTA